MSATLNRLTDTFAKFDVSADVASGTAAVVTGSGTGRLRVSQRAEKSVYGIGAWLLAAGVVAAVAVGASRLQALRSAELAPAESAADAVPVVNVARPAPAGAAAVELPATVRPWQTSDLHARVSGYLTAWHFDLGAPVQAGDLLAEIETPELDQELAEGEALATEAAAAVVQAKAERAEARADLKVAEAQLTRIQAEAELAKSQLARREKLLATRAIARDDYETFSTQVDARTAEVAAAQADVLRRRTNLETRGAIIAVREATAKSRRANAERLRELQVFKRIVAPFAGVVTHRTAEVGMLVTAGKESLFTLEDLSRVRVQVHVPQAYALHTALARRLSSTSPSRVCRRSKARLRVRPGRSTRPAAPCWRKSNSTMPRTVITRAATHK